MQPEEKNGKLSPKIFGIGFNKTGTTTLKRCYEKLGITPVCPTKGAQIRRATHKIFDDHDYGPMLGQVEKYRSFEDRPWNVWEAYRHLDERFPDSLFILTVRDPANWWRSVERWISVSKPWMARRYRTHLRAANLLPETMIEAYLRYNQDVRDYFADSERLLEINFEAGQGWPELCEFLHLPIPNRRFPHTNTQSYSADDNKRRSERISKKDERRNETSQQLTRKSGIQGSECRYCKKHASTLDLGRQWLTQFAAFIYKTGSFGRKIPTAAVSTDSGSTSTASAAHSDKPSLGIVCCYINPSRNALIRRQFEECYQSLLASNASVRVVEAIDESNPVSDLPASINSLPVPIGAVWSHNYLLNCGIRSLLAEGVDAIAWLDAGVTLDSPQAWAESVCTSLKTHRLVQAFQVATVITAGAAPAQQVSAVKYFQDHGKLLDQSRKKCRIGSETIDAAGHGGYAWAARSDVFRQHTLFEDLPYNADPRMLFTASYPIDDLWFKQQEKLTRYQFSPCKACLDEYTACDFRWSYLTWAQHWSLVTGGAPGFIQENITVCQPTKDKPRHRMDQLIRYDYQPKVDSRSTPTNGWHFDPQDKNFLKAVKQRSPLR